MTLQENCWSKAPLRRVEQNNDIAAQFATLVGKQLTYCYVRRRIGNHMILKGNFFQARLLNFVVFIVFLFFINIFREDGAQEG